MQKNLLCSTNDYTDRTAEIEEILNSYGSCVLEAGLYVVRGVKMPDSTMLSGAGAATKILLHPDVEDGFTVKIGSYCTVKNLMVMGSEELIPLPNQVGTRHGLLFSGDAVPVNWNSEIADRQPRNSIVTECYGWSFTGGGITCTDTGYSVQCSLTISNCHFSNCGAGINISRFSEFHKISNVLSNKCLYGCVNNGGNNVFTNCGFDSNEVAFMIDNSEGQSKNNSHGSVVGCTINHSGRDKGIGILLLGAKNGYVFTGCQMFYSKIVVEDSIGINFNSFLFGPNAEISVEGGEATMFTDCMFHSQPLSVKASDKNKVKFFNCITVDGLPVEPF